MAQVAMTMREKPDSTTTPESQLKLSSPSTIGLVADSALMSGRSRVTTPQAMSAESMSTKTSPHTLQGQRSRLSTSAHTPIVMARSVMVGAGARDELRWTSSAIAPNMLAGW